MTLLNTEIFKPLSPETPVRPQDEFRVSVLPNAIGARPFAGLSPHSAGAGRAEPGGKKCEPSVTVQREGDRITQIRVQCACGEVMELACHYDPPAGNA